jgi:SOS-response transcriptional repressor LexA
MTKSKAVAARARLEIAKRLTGIDPAHDGGGVELNPEYLDDPEMTIILRMDEPGFNEPHVSRGDLVIADRRVKPDDGCLVVAMLGGGMVVRRFSISGGVAFLCAGDGSCERTEGTGGGRPEILAAVVSVIPVEPG